MEYSFGIPLTKTVSVNSDLTDRRTKYVRTRIKQLHEDMSKAKDPHDQQWYNRLIQELEWVEQMRKKPTHNCYMQDTDARKWFS